MTKRVSVITTVYNEENNIAALLDALLAQTRQPDEIVICDAGSTDRTTEIISRYVARGLPVRLAVAPGANRARGRNLAIRQAAGEVIASTDGGCIPDAEWLARLVAPFESEEPPEVVSGYYRPAASSLVEEAVAAATVPEVAEVDPGTFLPSGRSVAFAREAWERLGGYPETIPFAEDTAFDLRLRAAGCRFQFAPTAVVRWRMQGSARAVFRQFFRYAESDGELGHWFGHYAKARAGAAAVALAAALTIWDWRGALLFPSLALLYWGRYAVRAWGRGARWRPGLLAPAISLVVDAANLTGYMRGRLRRRPRPSALPMDRPLSLTQVTYTYQPIAGGADVYVSQLAELIASAGHHHLVYQRRTEGAPGDVRFVPNPWRGRALEFWTQAFGLLALRRELLGHDLVICHYPHYLLALYLMSWGRDWPTRVGLSHGVFWDDAPGSFRSLLKVLLTRLAFRRAHLYIANDSEFLRAMGLQIAPGQGMHSQVAPGAWFIPNGVDTEKFRPSPPIPEIAALNPILVPRNLFRNRGIHLAIEAFELFMKDFSETKLLIVGGGGQPDYVADMRKRIERRGLTESVFFHGPVPHDELPGIYSSSHMTLIPSLCGEGTSLAALESMACGIATICTEVAGLKDLPGPHSRPTPVGLAEVMRQVYPDRARIGEEQREKVLSGYTIEKWRKAWETALSTVGYTARVSGEAPPPPPLAATWPP
jgi:glycosyltransferase involved in cell wall biosynthesis